MALDPYRTLGLERDASAAEIKRAYRRLAKANHPDSAGEDALPRFLAIQAAYEMLAGAGGNRGPGGSPPSPTRAPSWQAATDRAEATREGWRARAGRGRSGAPGGRRPSGAAGSADGGPGSAPPGSAPPGSAPGGPAAGRGRARRSRAGTTATPGSTSYDGATDEPFDPEWSGASWYGTTSGTYWTINPKEYADPRKHGPEYQARARRGAGSGGAPAPDPSADRAGGADTATPVGEADDPGSTSRGAPGPAPDDPFAASARGSASRATGQTRAPESRRRPPPASPPTSGGRTDASAPGAARSGFSLEPDLEAIVLRPLQPVYGPAGRVILGLVAWPPLGLLVAAVIGESTGCARFSAGCLDTLGAGTWLIQLLLVAVLIAVPRVAAIAAVGTVAALAAALPSAILLSASGGAREPAGASLALSGLLGTAYLVGVGYALIQRRRRARAAPAREGVDAGRVR